MFGKLDEVDLKIEELREWKDQSYTAKIHKQVSTSLALFVYYSKKVSFKETEYFSYRRMS